MLCCHWVIIITTILMQNLYLNPNNSTVNPYGTKAVSMEVEQAHFDEFFEDVFLEIEEKYGAIEEMNVCDNMGDHLLGNVYIKFYEEEVAEKAVMSLNNRWFNGTPIHCELSPVSDFREACCRQYEMGECTRGGFCNFMHLKPISRDLKRFLYSGNDRSHRRRRSRSRSRSRSPRRRRY
ncbi:splicing factor U2AF 35 kDa subunit-like isoform X4 [Dysidea avara]|uniref:splicing factor U2AF 35 kDa subunit-like isoform X4 n=1 Tax=Dysidea avara TaxID=196820 RepID=UPI00333031DC